MTKKLVKQLTEYVLAHEPNFGDGDSVLTLLYEAFSDANRIDNGQIKADFNELNRLMNGMDLRKIDKIIYPFCSSAEIMRDPGSWREARLASVYGRK